MTNFVMSLASSPCLQHPVQISSSEFCHYHYSNLPKVLKDWQVSEEEIQAFLAPFLPPLRQTPEGLSYYALTHDFTKLLKAHSPCLAGRQYVPTANNVIPSNRALGIGYPVSALHLGDGQAGWCPPLALKRIEVQENANEAALGQVETLLKNPLLPFGQQLCLLRTDASYGKAVFLSPLYAFEDLVVVTRLRSGMKVWRQAGPGNPDGSGAPKIYGEKYYLADASTEKTYHRKGKPFQVRQASLCEEVPSDECLNTEATLGNGRRVSLQIRRWINLLIRTKSGACMKKKPLDVLRISVHDAGTGAPVFKRPLFVAVCGKRKNELQSGLVQQQYRERYDVEPCYRFSKKSLLLDKLQTPQVEHLDTWLRLVQLSHWLLFTARGEIGQASCPVWQKYLPKNKEICQATPDTVMTIAQTQKSIHLLFRTFDQAPFLPLKCKKGKGRKKGTKFTPRPRFQVMKKPRKPPKKPR